MFNSLYSSLQNFDAEHVGDTFYHLAEIMTSEDIAPLITGTWLELDFSKVTYEDLFNSAKEVLEQE